MQSRVMITSELLNQLGFPAILEACHCRTPQGSRFKASVHFFGPENKFELEREVAAVNRLNAMVKDKQPQLIEALTQLARLRELRGTFSRLDKNDLLDDTEFFELKSSLNIFYRLSKLTDLLRAADIFLEDTSVAAALLNPDGKYNPSFHIYSSYSSALAEIRARKKELERQISQSAGAERATLLQQRSFVIAEEDQEEDRIRRDLGAKLAEWLPQMKHNTEACGLLDFRLAKADLANRWGGALPVILDEDCPAIITNAKNPQVSALLKNQGLEFTPLSIELRSGSTVLSGANMGGKSVALKTFFLALLMTQLGYLPVCERLQTPLYDFFAFEASLEGDVFRGLSSFGLEAVKIRDHYRRSQTQRGLIVLDEPCRGTNPSEATAIVQALCNQYGASDSSFLIATHYHVSPKPGIRFYQVKGINPEVLSTLESTQGKNHVPQADSSSQTAGVSAFALHTQREDLIRVRKIQNLMDYQLEEVDGLHPTPSGAIKIAELLGVDEALISEMKAAWQEE